MCPAHLPQEGNQVLGPGGTVLHTDCAEELNQGLHWVTGMDIVGPLVWKQVETKREKKGWKGWIKSKVRLLQHKITDCHNSLPIHAALRRLSPLVTTSLLQRRNPSPHLQRTGRSLGLRAQVENLFWSRKSFCTCDKKKKAYVPFFAKCHQRLVLLFFSMHVTRWHHFAYFPQIPTNKT